MTNWHGSMHELQLPHMTHCCWSVYESQHPRMTHCCGSVCESQHSHMTYYCGCVCKSQHSHMTRCFEICLQLMRVTYVELYLCFSPAPVNQSNDQCQRDEAIDCEVDKALSVYVSLDSRYNLDKINN